MRVLKCALLFLLAGCTSPETPEESQPFSAPSQGGAPEREPSFLPEPQETSPSSVPASSEDPSGSAPSGTDSTPAEGPISPSDYQKAFGEGDGCRLVQNRQGERGLS